ncbi:betaine/proline/choline family ABC transporter ATP-binding protein [Ruegeria pomeroyi]|uniref:Quaternary amine transport ATP-binding protein n=2 Tax=Ruegeria pomeroyi TaxID=89184 RepID=Q5LUC2_RUEPO|nr:betaine/proline/choline family ABC transporter ATP-binding protein [Ruegeria pomeroyi]AAV94432.1 glycine betaine/proline ABC transporter, ATP-binding protein [Ruegeria pomeroyi DSS-3]NVK99434.1 betaine/proline/choline family ABC transporter ATP-binding protein [Ruegeria pomeroyi]NVL04117.1 betaine/proline/choline family ABC transporter ATP-binding protein [Ruegeria pomeroyi]QWV08014.1 betaine/proline/choline family ABC transporter ATP-binding protein [Ruegeria pomeroyi]
MTEATTPAITCQNLWQVFGPGANDALAEALARSGGDAEAAAAELRDKGLIPAVQDASFEVREGELFVIMGLSGSGKSTLIRCISQLLPGTGGEIRIEGDNVVGASKKRLTELRRRKLGMVFQHFGLFPHMTVAENVAYPLKVQGVGRKERRARAQEVISLVGLEGREDSFPRQLSGGQRQRVGIARSLAVNPDIWFLDEPFSALDPLIRRQLQDEFLRIQATLKKSIVFITHDIAEALKLADRIAIMRDGKIVQIGTPTEIVLNPVDDYVREFSKDVAKGRHAKVASVMRAGVEEQGPDDPGLTAGMTLDTALARCMQLYQPVPVRDASGAIVGTVQPSDLAAALQVDDT